MQRRSYYDATGYPISTGQPQAQQITPLSQYKHNLQGDQFWTGGQTTQYIDPWTVGKREWRHPRRPRSRSDEYINPITGGQGSSIYWYMNSEPVYNEPEDTILDRPADMVLSHAERNTRVLENHGALGKALSIPYNFAMGALYGLASLVSPKAWKNTIQTLENRFKKGTIFPDLTGKPEIGSPSRLAFTLGSIAGPLLLGETASKPPDYMAPDTAATIAEAREAGAIADFKLMDHGGVKKAVGYIKAGSRESTLVESRLGAMESDKLLWVREDFERGPVRKLGNYTGKTKSGSTATWLKTPRYRVLLYEEPRGDIYRRAWIAWDLGGGKRIVGMEEWKLDLEAGKYDLRRVTIDPLEKASLDTRVMPREIEELLEPPVFKVGGRNVPVIPGLYPMDTPWYTGGLSRGYTSNIPGIIGGEDAGTREGSKEKGSLDDSTLNDVLGGGNSGAPPILSVPKPSTPRRRRRNVKLPVRSRRSRKVSYAEILYPEPSLPF
ncbi:MAG: hypothetical protein GSR82_00820 [Desulfurococcales archaeon]|nr:hypothetical protein [Desulfurococcales archaeon]